MKKILDRIKKYDIIKHIRIKLEEFRQRQKREVKLFYPQTNGRNKRLLTEQKIAYILSRI